MPDHIELVATELLALNLALEREIKLVLVRKEGTSKLHSICGHILERAGDSGKCPVCGIVVDMHKNSAENIEKKVKEILEQFTSYTDLVVHLPPVNPEDATFGSMRVG